MRPVSEIVPIFNQGKIFLTSWHKKHPMAIQILKYKRTAGRVSAEAIMPIVITTVLAITVLQDFLEARHHNFAFYFSESILFKSFWLLFLPGGWIMMMLLDRYKTRPAVIRFLAVGTAVILAHMLIYACSVYGLSALFLDHRYSIGGTLQFTVADDLYKYLFIYGALMAIHVGRKVQPQTQSITPTEYADRIVLAEGKNHLAIPVDEILYIQPAGHYIAIHTIHRKYLHTETLRSALGRLDPEQFIRVHKSAIINLREVISFSSRSNGDYDILMSNHQQVRLSRNYATAFKAAMKMQ